MYYIVCNTFYHKKWIKAILLSIVNRFYSKIDAFILPVLAEPEQINSMISRYYNSQKAMEAVEEFSRVNNTVAKGQNDAFTNKSAVQDVSESPAVKLVNMLIDQAIQSNASDIHIEPQENHIKVRFRIDGKLQDVMKPSIDALQAIVTRIKVASGLNITERRLPQDGRLSYKTGTDRADLRISITPTIFWEKVVIRISGGKAYDIPIENLGFLPENLIKFKTIMKKPYGIVLVTGPTGSGKTTTLYSAIKELNNSDVNIITIEDPVECVLEGINQIQINQKIGLDFASSLRSILRQDPDIILVGEIRDSETAEVAVRAAITGHLVLSTLHTNDAAGSIIRLIDMGIQSFLVSNSVIGIIAQRLVRRICTNCKSVYHPLDEEIDTLGFDKKTKPVFYQGSGCELCKGTGYKGRIAVHEIMEVGPELRHAIYKGESSDKLREIAAANDMISLQENCKRLALEGVTTLEEIIKVTWL